MRIVNETRERKRRPSLSEVIALYRKSKGEPGAKESFQDKFRKLYSDDADKDENELEQDERYKLLIETMTRIKKQFGSQQLSLNNLVMRVNNLLERKNRREADRSGLSKSKFAKIQPNDRQNAKKRNHSRSSSRASKNRTKATPKSISR